MVVEVLSAAVAAPVGIDSRLAFLLIPRRLIQSLLGRAGTVPQQELTTPAQTAQILLSVPQLRLPGAATALALIRERPAAADRAAVAAAERPLLPEQAPLGKGTMAVLVSVRVKAAVVVVALLLLERTAPHRAEVTVEPVWLHQLLEHL